MRPGRRGGWAPLVAAMAGAVCAASLDGGSALAQGARGVVVEAGRATLDHRRLELSCRARVRDAAGRWSLAADRITVAGGVVSATGRVVLRPCGAHSFALLADAVGVSGGRVRARGLRLRLFGMTTPRLPWLELLPETQPGFLPPELALRPDVGLGTGVGAHLPLGRAGAGLDARARVGTAGGGGELSMRGPAMHLDGSLSARRRGGVLARGSGGLSLGHRGLVWSADFAAREGPRRWLAPDSADRLRRADRLALGMATGGRHLSAASVVEAWRPSGEGAWTVAAPRSLLRSDASLGPLRVAASSDFEAVVGRGVWLRPSLDAAVLGHVGPLRLSSTGRAELRDATAARPGRAMRVAASARASLRGRLGAAVHRITPVLGVGAAALVRHDAASVGRSVEALPASDGLLAVAGLGSSLTLAGRRLADGELAVRLPLEGRVEPLSMGASVRVVAGGIELAGRASWGVARARPPVLVTAGASLRRRGGASLGVDLLHASAGASGLPIGAPLAAEPRGGSFSLPRPATLAGAHARSPWLGPLAVAAGAELDVRTGHPTRLRGQLDLRDGCLVVSLAAAWAWPDALPAFWLAVELGR